MYLSIVLLPLLGSIVSGFFGRKVGVTGSRFVCCLMIMSTTILAIISFFEVGFNNNLVKINLFKWLTSQSFNMAWNLQFDSLTVSMLIPVLVISCLVHFYSIGYMSHDPHNQRFFSYLSLFTFMMIILVTGNNYLVMFVGWEGVGVCSYLLVSFWFTRIAANQSSLAAFLTNRVGDCLLTIGMFVMLWCLGNLDYNVIFSIAPYVNENVLTIISICLFIGAMAKSSQVGLHIWLPMAMEGPTPVSALIHAATMVTAGVYLLIRSSPLIEYSSTVLLICLWLGAITTVFSSLIGLFQQDIKKIIAYSTMSQLGMMVIAIGLSSYNIAIFHLINHAFYKGLLFLGAGSVIHAVVDNQDLRRYGGLIRFLPLTYTVILIASLSLVAFPFMTGFYSKDFILESAYGQYCFSSINVYFIAVIGAIFTTLYSVKVLYLTFLTNPNGSINYYKNAHEGDIFLSLPLVILAIFSIYFGYLTKDIFIGLGSGFFIDNSIFIHPMHEILIDTEFAVDSLFKLLPLILTILFSTLAIIYPEFIPSVIYNFKLSSLGYYVFGFFNQRFMVEYFYNKYIVNGVLKIGGQTTKVLDKGSIELVGPFGMGILLTRISKTISNLSQGVVTDYALYLVIGVCFYLSIYSFFPRLFDLVNSNIMSSLMVLLAIHYFKVYICDENDENNKLELLNSSVFPILSKKSQDIFKVQQDSARRTFCTTSYYLADRNPGNSSNNNYPFNYNNGASSSSNNNASSSNNNNNPSNYNNGASSSSNNNYPFNYNNGASSSSNNNGASSSNNNNPSNHPLGHTEENRDEREYTASLISSAMGQRVDPDSLVLDNEGYWSYPPFEREASAAREQREQAREERDEEWYSDGITPALAYPSPEDSPIGGQPFNNGVNPSQPAQAQSPITVVDHRELLEREQEAARRTRRSESSENLYDASGSEDNSRRSESSEDLYGVSDREDNSRKRARSDSEEDQGNKRQRTDENPKRDENLNKLDKGKQRADYNDENTDENLNKLDKGKQRADYNDENTDENLNKLDKGKQRADYNDENKPEDSENKTENESRKRARSESSEDLYGVSDREDNPRKRVHCPSESSEDIYDVTDPEDNIMKMAPHAPHSDLDSEQDQGNKRQCTDENPKRDEDLNDNNKGKKTDDNNNENPKRDEDLNDNNKDKKTDDNDDGKNNGGSGPSEGGFSSGPSGSSGGTGDSGSGPTESSSCNSSINTEKNSSDSDLIWLEIVLNIIKAILGDDDYMD